VKYAAGEARAWALQELEGCCGCVMPTFTSDLSKLNEPAIRHDVAMEKQLGMKAILLVSECGTTPQEMRRFVEIAVDEAGDDLVTVLQGSEPTLQDTIASIQHAEQAGVDLVLLSYPLMFHPETEEEIFGYTKAINDCSNLGVIIFAMHLWNFGRFHPSEFNPALLRRFVEELPNVAGIKNEIGMPGVGGISQVFETFRDVVMVTDPLEMNSPAWTRAYGMRFMGTSNYEAMADRVPKYFDLLKSPDTYDQGMDIYWQMHPVRQASMKVLAEASAGTGMVHRLFWKYQGWLFGLNGGPIRQPHLRIFTHQMTTMRTAAERVGLPVTDDDDHAFFEGRNPA
jgi:4-hydroxy-tetrahydrodipicolinate synthase